MLEALIWIALAVMLLWRLADWLLSYFAKRLPQYVLFVQPMPPTDAYTPDDTEASAQTVTVPPVDSGGFTGGGGGRSGGGGAGGSV